MTTAHRAIRLFVLLVLLIFVAVITEWQRIRPLLRSKPLREPAKVCFPPSGKDDAEYLAGTDFHPVSNVRDLPSPIVQRFREAGGRRLTIVNPGEHFESTDFITDETLPRRRLIFAVVSGSVTVLQYERGGWGLSRIAEAYETDSTTLRPLWRRYCTGSARDVQTLRLMVISGECVPETEWNQGSPPCTP